MLLPDNLIDALVNADETAIDIETKDPKLTTHGPGCYRGDGHICGLSASAGNGASVYLPFAHPDVSVKDAAKYRNIAALVLNSESSKVGANIMYDLEWLGHEGFTVRGAIHDVQFAEPLLDEYSRSFRLDSLAKKYEGDSKKTSILEDYNDKMGWKGKAITNIWRMPSEVAGEYAIKDVELPLEIIKKQRRELEKQGLMEVYQMECDLIPLLLQMRKQGVRLDMEKLESVVSHVTEKRFQATEELEEWAGFGINPNSTHALAKMFDKKGIPYPLNQPTEKMRLKGKPGNPNLDKRVLASMVKDYPVCQSILDWRHNNTLASTFLLNYLDFQVDGRIHGSFHPLRSDDYGTVSGRFSASKPNLQNVPGDNEDDGEMVGQIIRSFFMPEIDYDWAKLDYSQVEYRIMAHYAMGPKSEELRESYNLDPTTDYHALVMEWTGLERKAVKRLNFGAAYGMGIATSAANNGWTMEEAETNMKKLHGAAPYIKPTRNAVNNAAKRRGYIYTIMGRRARFHPSRSQFSFFNRLIQGSAADVMKKGMVDAYKHGLFDVLLPHLTVHDEIGVSVPRSQAGTEALAELKYDMEHAIKFNVPLLVDCSMGANWAENSA